VEICIIQGITLQVSSIPLVTVDLLIVLLYLTIFLWFTLKWKVIALPGLPSWSAPALLLLKFIAGLAITWIYTYIYKDRSQADIFKLFDDSRFMHEAIYKHPADFFRMLTGLDDGYYYDRYYLKMNNWYRPYELDNSVYYDTRTLIRMNAFVRLFSFGIYPVHVLVWSFLSLTGLSLLYKAFYRYLSDTPVLLAGAIFLLPSVLCWSSGVLKEGIVFLFMGILIYSLNQWFVKGFKWIYPVLVIASFFGFFLLKIYILLALIPGIIAFLICRLTQFKRVILCFSSVILLIGVAALNIQHVFPSVNFMEILSGKQQAILRLAWYVNSGSVVEVSPLEPNITSFLLHWPEALSNTTLRPFLWEATNGLQWLAAIENLFIGICIILSIVFFKRQANNEQLAVLMFCVSFTIILFSIMGLTTPVLGSLVRYRMPALPFLFAAMLLITDTRRMSKFFNRNRNGK